MVKSLENEFVVTYDKAIRGGDLARAHLAISGYINNVVAKERIERGDCAIQREDKRILDKRKQR